MITGSASVDSLLEAKHDGQDTSLLSLLETHETAFLNAVRALAPGTAFTANTIRPTLDRAEVPPGQRAALMRRACALGLAEPVTFNVGGDEIHIKVPSTGKTARRAYVALYRRPAVHAEGR